MQSFNFSVWGMFLHADFVVKLLILLLLASSVYTWTVIFHQFKKRRLLNKSALKFEKIFWSGGSLEVLSERVIPLRDDPIIKIFIVGMKEWGQFKKKEVALYSQARKDVFLHTVETKMHVTMRQVLTSEEQVLGHLSTLSAASPFVGLFGTVWGIMNSLQGVSMSQSTHLAAVAPGVAEALFATALGLAVAIPALVSYNYFSKNLDAYEEKLCNFQQELLCIIRSKLEEI